MNGFERIKSYYKIKNFPPSNILFSNIDGGKILIPKSEKNIVFTFGKKIVEKNVLQEIQKGNVVIISGFELYKEYFNWSDKMDFEDL